MLEIKFKTYDDCESDDLTEASFDYAKKGYKTFHYLGEGEPGERAYLVCKDEVQTEILKELETMFAGGTSVVGTRYFSETKVKIAY